MEKARRRFGFYYGKRLLIFVGTGVIALALSIFVQSAMCWICRVPFRSTLGQTFEWRLAYLRDLSEEDRSLIIAKIDAKAADPVVTDALEGFLLQDIQLLIAPVPRRSCLYS